MVEVDFPISLKLAAKFWRMNHLLLYHNESCKYKKRAGTVLTLMEHFIDIDTPKSKSIKDRMILAHTFEALTSHQRMASLPKKTRLKVHRFA